MSAHTLGPWRVHPGDGWRNIMPTDSHGAIAKVRMRRSKAGNLTELDANARLIAAAPDLLDALNEMIGYVDDRQDCLEAVERALAAIAKAEGRIP